MQQSPYTNRWSQNKQPIKGLGLTGLWLVVTGALALVILSPLEGDARPGKSAKDQMRGKARKAPLHQTAPPVRYTVAPRVSSRIVMKTVPGAVSILHREGAAAARGLKLSYADRDGMVRFHVRPAAESKAIAKFFVESKVGGKVRRYPLELRVSSKPTAKMPAPALEGRKARPTGASVRRALSKHEMRSLSDTELRKRRYPKRPDPKKEPRAFAAWSRAVSRPGIALEPQTISRRDIRTARPRRGRLAAVRPARALRNRPRPGAAPVVSRPNTTSIWSGFVLTGSPGTYESVSAFWTVPTVANEVGPGGIGTSSYSTLWVGLDGYGISELVQAGTEQDSVVSAGDPTMLLSSFYTWSEVLPQQPTEQPLLVPISGGDDVFVHVFVGTSAGGPSLPATTAYFELHNLTTGAFQTTSTPLGSTKFIGSTAEWIMERPTFAGQPLPDLANYGSAMMTFTQATRAGGQVVSYQDDPNDQVTMTSDGTASGTTLSTVTPVDTSSIRFDWKAFR